MKKDNQTRSTCKDVFNAFMVSDADYAGEYEFPTIQPTQSIPNRLISFSNALNTKDFDQWVHFYQDDVFIERVWRRPKVYLPILKNFIGVILPDFSVYRDMPFAMQIWNIYRSRTFGHWLQSEGVEVIPNLRFGDERTYDICCNGISPNSVIAVGSHGTMKGSDDRFYFTEGLDHIVSRLRPSAIVVYGTAHDAYFFKYKEQGIVIHQFSSDINKVHRKEAD